MTDVFSKAKRSAIMACIRGRGNKGTEIAFMKLLRRHHISGWRRQMPLTVPKPNGRSQAHLNRRSTVTPDFVFRGLRVAVFIDGCFWHGCPLHATKPASNREFWNKKLADNRARDRYVTEALRRHDWTVLRIWEHQLRHGDRLMARVNRSFARAASDQRSVESRPAAIRVSDQTDGWPTK